MAIKGDQEKFHFHVFWLVTLTKTVFHTQFTPKRCQIIVYALFNFLKNEILNFSFFEGGRVPKDFLDKSVFQMNTSPSDFSGWLHKMTVNALASSFCCTKKFKKMRNRPRTLWGKGIYNHFKLSTEDGIVSIWRKIISKCPGLSSKTKEMKIL